jgi:uncharacterized OB-fold protein
MNASPLPPPPLPEPSELTRPFWDWCKKRELRIQRCLDCGSLIHYPKLHCPKDGSTRFEWARMSGRATVESFVVSHRAFHQAFKPELPQVVAIVQLAEGPRMMTNIIGTDPDNVRIGMDVAVEFVDVSEQFALPKFRPSGGPR